MKILFVTLDFIIEPLGIMYLSGALKKAGHQVHILKTIYQEYEKYALQNERHHPAEVVRYEKTIVDLIKKISPDILAYSLTTGMHQYYLRLNKKIRQKVNALSVFGGPHPTFFPEIIENEFVDAICIGEGEVAFVEFANRLQEAGNITNIRNFWVKQNGRIYRNEVRPLIENLDNIPFPDRELIYEYETSLNNPIKNIICSRGCPFDCTYCFNHAYFEIYKNNGRRLRYRSADNIIQELEELKSKYPVSLIYFQDDTFGISKSWVSELLGLYKKRIGLPFHCHLRVDLMDEEFIRELKDVGCKSVTLALESGNDDLRTNLLNRNMSRKQILDGCRLLKEYKIRFRAENMVGLPTGSLKTALETLKLNIECKPDIGWASLYQPYPRTRLGELCRQMQLFDGKLDSIKPSFFETSILNIPHKKEMENFQKLFSLTVEYSFLLPLVLWLIRLPPNPVFEWIYKKWKNYCYSKRLYDV